MVVYIPARDPSNDLALLSTKLPASGFPSFRLNLKQGEQLRLMDLHLEPILQALQWAMSLLLSDWIITQVHF